MNRPSNRNISLVICSKDSFDDVCFHLKNADKYSVGEIIFVTSCENEIEEILSYQNKLNTSLILIKDDGTGIGQARSKGLEKVSKEYLIFLGPDNRIESNSISKILNQLVTSKFKALAFSQKIPCPKKYLEKCQNFRFKNKFPTFISRDVIGTPHIVNAEDARKIGYNTEVDCCDDTIFFNAFIETIGPIACSDIHVDEVSQNILKRMIWYGKSDFQFLETLQKRSFKNFIHSFITETRYIFYEKNILATVFYLPGIILMATTRQYSFIKLWLKSHKV